MGSKQFDKLSLGQISLPEDCFQERPLDVACMHGNYDRSFRFGMTLRRVAAFLPLEFKPRAFQPLHEIS